MGRGLASITVPDVQEFHLPHVSANFYQLYLFFPQFFHNFRRHMLALRMGDSPTRESPGYATVHGSLMQIKNHCEILGPHHFKSQANLSAPEASFWHECHGQPQENLACELKFYWKICEFFQHSPFHGWTHCNLLFHYPPPQKKIVSGSLGDFRVKRKIWRGCVRLIITVIGPNVSHLCKGIFY